MSGPSADECNMYGDIWRRWVDQAQMNETCTVTYEEDEWTKRRWMQHVQWRMKKMSEPSACLWRMLHHTVTQNWCSKLLSPLPWGFISDHTWDVSVVDCVIGYSDPCHTHTQSIVYLCLRNIVTWKSCHILTQGLVYYLDYVFLCHTNPIILDAQLK
jgi:hypothetical protein